ncbi:O-antigen ligase domain-containing protein [Knoellia sp. Soil729]|uniref:O-antigen ligase domain-containing protein n=1 Tax=Knoellia sp. Soil729 TaxID=1736394 RepID=UPI000AC0CD1A|nr:O-antigen ligase domain-containing protein [Knoellia sp. Soil729]
MTVNLQARTAPEAGGRPVARPHRVPVVVLTAWAALFLNVMPPASVETLVPIPPRLLQLVTQGALVLALSLALLANRRLLVRPTLFLGLLTVLALASFVVSLGSEFFLGSLYRGVRLVLFVTVLWLLSPWWGRRDLVLLRAHRLCLWGVLVTVIVGAAVAPGKAFAFEGRLGGALWPVPATQVAHFAAVLFGTTLILWLCHLVTGRHALVAVVVTVAVLIGTHTRTALLGALLGTIVASASLFLGHARVRRFSISTLIGLIVGATLFAPQVVNWLARGQSASEASRLTGRTDVWAAIAATPRPLLEQMFGSGLSNKSFDGLAVDSNWLASYVDQGWFGVLVEMSFVLVLLLAAATHVQGPRRALALFLIVYCIIASITETGLGDASPYLLELAVAASLLAAPAEEVGR